jgi:hypothetical protein
MYGHMMHEEDLLLPLDAVLTLGCGDVTAAFSQHHQHHVEAPEGAISAVLLIMASTSYRTAYLKGLQRNQTKNKAEQAELSDQVL